MYFCNRCRGSPSLSLSLSVPHPNSHSLPGAYATQHVDHIIALCTRTHTHSGSNGVHSRLMRCKLTASQRIARRHLLKHNATHACVLIKLERAHVRARSSERAHRRRVQLPCVSVRARGLHYISCLYDTRFRFLHSNAYTNANAYTHRHAAECTQKSTRMRRRSAINQSARACARRRAQI